MRAMEHRILCVIVALLAMPAPALADVFRCTAPAGGVTYQQVPCPNDNAERVLPLPEQFPEVNREARQALLQREAALEARQLEREKMDTALRIAREDRLAREAEARAQQLAAEPSTPFYLVAQPLRLRPMPLRHRPLHPRPRGNDRPL